MRTCWTESTIIPQWPIKLLQRGKDSFDVHYGLQRKERLTYSEAALELGSCIMHALACESRLDNRAKGEH